jgi:hypothetical protein
MFGELSMDFKDIKPIWFALPKKPPKVVMVLDADSRKATKQGRKPTRKRPKIKPPSPNE